MTGLIGWWPLHENSGNTAHDLSGNGNHGSLNGGVTQGVAGKGGLNAHSFDGSDDGISISQLSFESSEPYTVAFWAKIDMTHTHRLIGLDSDDDNHVRLEPTNRGFGMEGDANGAGFAAEPSIPSGWNHYTISHESNSSEIRFYINGSDKGLGNPASTAYKVNDLGKGTSSSDIFDGILSDVRIYNRALTPQEIQTLYEWGSGDYTDRSYHDGSDSGAVSRLRFDGDATDSWASNDGTNNGASFVNNSIRGQAASFDSGDDSIDISKTLLDHTTDFTVSLWLSPDNVTPSEEAQVLMENGREVTMSIKNGEMRHMIYDGSSRLSESHYNIPASAWTFWTLTWDASTNTGKFYKNRVHNPAGNNDANGNKDHTGFKLGDHPSSGWSYEGLMDDVRIYNRTLNPQEVFQLYQWGTRGRDMRKLTVNSRGDQ
jgi:hypothetical protein